MIENLPSAQLNDQVQNQPTTLHNTRTIQQIKISHNNAICLNTSPIRMHQEESALFTLHRISHHLKNDAFQPFPQN